MHDVFISYSHLEWPRAQAVDRGLREAGRTVWLDEPSGTDPMGVGLAGVPAGQPHRQAIEAGIEQAGAFLAMGSPLWLASQYCTDELAHARKVGKRVAVMAPLVVPLQEGAHVLLWHDDVHALLRALEPGNTVARAHARLYVDMASPTPRRSWRSRLSQDRDQVRDAELVSNADLPSLGMRVDPALAGFCERVQREAARRSRMLRGAVAAFMAVVLALTLVALVGRQMTVQRRDDAQSAANQAISLQLAQQALSAKSTASGLDLARRAVRSQPTTAARGVLTRLRSQARYLRQVRVQAAMYTSAAVSSNGEVALLATDDSFAIADIATGTSRALAAPGTLQRDRLALSPDGAHGYALSLLGDLICLDVARRNVLASTVTEVVDLSIAPDGSLWWVTSGGEVGHAPSCPLDVAVQRYRVAPGVSAFALLPDRRGLAVLSDDYVLTTYPLPAGSTVIPQQVEARPGVAMSDLTSDRGLAWVVDPSNRGPDAVIVCGGSVHVMAQTKRSSAPFPSAHAVFDLEGRPMGGRESTRSTSGIACGPGQGAWIAQSLATEPTGLPGTEAFPVGIMDGRDAGSRLAVADSADHGHTVVAHRDGRIDVLVPGRAPWGRTVGQAAVAVPLLTGTVTIDADGTARWWTDEGGQAVGSVEAAPSPEAVVGLEDRALIGVGDEVVEVNAGGVGRLVQLTDEVRALSLSPSGDEVLALTGAGWFTLASSLDGAPRAVRPPPLESGEIFTSVGMDGDRMITSTTLGRLVLSNLDGEVLHSVQAHVAGATAFAVGPDHGILAIGQDGVLRSYDAALSQVRSAIFGAGGLRLTLSADGRTAVLSLVDFSVWAVDPTTLRVQQPIGEGSADVRLIAPSPDATRITRLVPGQDSEYATRPAALETLPLYL